MNPELDRLVEALYRSWICKKEEERQARASYRRMLLDVVFREHPPKVTASELHQAILPRAEALRKARRREKYSSIPPKA
jgi:hypothetical protein